MNCRKRRRMVWVFPALFLTVASLAGEAQQFLSESADGTYYFHGTIDQTLEIAMVLSKHGKKFDGEYMYASQAKRLSSRLLMLLMLKVAILTKSLLSLYV